MIKSYATLYLRVFGLSFKFSNCKIEKKFAKLCELSFFKFIVLRRKKKLQQNQGLNLYILLYSLYRKFAQYKLILNSFLLFRWKAPTFQLLLPKPSALKTKTERSVYNKRKRNLFYHINQIREKLAMCFNKKESYFVIDSMPLKICDWEKNNFKWQ